jgi:enoyl-CoA hydratase/carnithine racemase
MKTSSHLISLARKRLTAPIPNLVFRFSSSSTTNNNPASTRIDSNTNKERVTIQHLPNGIHHVQLNRPDKLNALDMEMFRALADAARQLKKDKSVRAIILSGKGRAFCTGLDVKSIISPWSTDDSYKITSPTAKMDELMEKPSRSRREHDNDNEGNETQETVQDLYKRVRAVGNLAQDIAYLWRDIPVPVIAVLNGLCLGGGLQLALGADLRYATPDCKLSVMEAKWGLIPDMSASITMRELVRIDVAKELTFTGRIVDGVEAERLGLVTRCCENPMEEAMKWAEMIVSRSPDSIAGAKMLYQRTWVSSEKECLETETVIQERLLKSWNQIAASAKNFGINAPYKERQDFDD